jgi:vancomycin resistance protein YoaR
MHGLELIVTAAAAGRALEDRALLADLRRAALEGGIATAVFVRVEPRRTAEDAALASATARDLVAAPVYVFYDGRPLTSLEPPQLARVVSFQPRGGEFLVTLDRDRLANVLKPAIGVHERAAVDATFKIVGDRVRVVPDRPGLGLDVDAALNEVTAAAYAPDRRIAEVSVHRVDAAVTAPALHALGITRRISTFTTDMGVSSSNRIWNVQLMADYIDGTIIKPGKVFSFNGVVGKRTVERGFREGQMIVGSLLLPSIGGGVCQTATTLFNNAFELGLPVLRRYNHSFYISHYPMGRDATVSWGGPDLVFKNDLKHAILIKSSYTSSTLTFTFYGTPQGRRVVSTTSSQTNWRGPQTSYAYDPYAPAGSIRTSSGSNQSGFDVTVGRTVYERGDVIRRDAFKSRYIPVGPTVVYGPGTNPPRVDFTLPPPE